MKKSNETPWEEIFSTWQRQNFVSDPAHDLSHILRVVRSAKEICKIEGANLDVVIPSAYLHDCIIVPKESKERASASTLASKIVQDADRLDALGAIGIARCLALGGAMGTAIVSSEDPFCKTREPEDKKYMIDHFYAKLFKLESTMRTGHGRKLAQERTVFMQEYLAQLGGEL